jgi:Spy/CpxP family protein refolding chaperone
VSLSSRTVAAVVVIVAFFTGALAGVVGDRVYIFRHGLPRPPRAMTSRIVEHLTHELNLTKPQHDAVAAIVERHRVRMDAIADSMRPQMQKEIESANAEIEQQLTPEQKTKFAQLRMKMHSRRGRRS